MKKKKIFYVILLSFMIINFGGIGNFDSDVIIQMLAYHHGGGSL